MRNLRAVGAGRSGRSDISERMEDDTFTAQEMRIALTAFALWLYRTDTAITDGDEAMLVDRFIDETT